MDEKQVAMHKFRALEQIRNHLPAKVESLDETESPDSILTRVWENLRPTCPKRSTLGRYVLNTLESPWREHVEFHLNQLGCRFCQANLEDLKRESQAEPAPLRERIFQSTVGFLTAKS